MKHRRRSLGPDLGHLLLFALLLGAAALPALAGLLPARASAATAGWSFDPASWDFGARLPEEGRSEPNGFVLTNTGEVPLEPALVSLVSGEENDFGMSNHCRSSLLPGGSCEVDVTFRTTTAGPKTATLEVSERNSLTGPAAAELRGTGAAPVVTVGPPELAFGSVLVGSRPPLQTVTVTNQGPGELHFESVTTRSLSGPGGEPFQIFSNGCEIANALVPGSSCSISIGFGAFLVGTDLGELSIADTAADSPQALKLFATADPIPPSSLNSLLPPEAVTLTHRPGRHTSARNATFAFSGGPSTARFQCSLGGGPLVSSCRSPVRYRNLKPGRHLFRVRPVGGDGVPGPVVNYRWRIIR